MQTKSSDRNPSTPERYPVYANLPDKWSLGRKLYAWKPDSQIGKVFLTACSGCSVKRPALVSPGVVVASPPTRNRCGNGRRFCVFLPLPNCARERIPAAPVF